MCGGGAYPAGHRWSRTLNPPLLSMPSTLLMVKVLRNQNAWPSSAVRTRPFPVGASEALNCIVPSFLVQAQVEPTERGCAGLSLSPIGSARCRSSVLGEQGRDVHEDRVVADPTLFHAKSARHRKRLRPAPIPAGEGHLRLHALHFALFPDAGPHSGDVVAEPSDQREELRDALLHLLRPCGRFAVAEAKGPLFGEGLCERSRVHRVDGSEEIHQPFLPWGFPSAERIHCDSFHLVDDTL